MITILLISSTAAIHIAGGEEFKPESNEENSGEELPTFEGIEKYSGNRTIDMDTMSTRQKIATMIVSYRYSSNISEDEIVGGIHLRSNPSKQAFKDRVNKYKEGRKIQPLISTDLEGCIEPTGNFRDFRSFKKINNTDQAYELGKAQGKFLNEIGADINFAPVVDLEDNIWECRSFPGNYREVSNKSCAYIEGLHSQEIMATAKHYPGATLTGIDPHQEIKSVETTSKDLYPFNASINCGADAVMPSHQISGGEVNTQGVPADASNISRKNLRTEKNFSGLIISDAISMGGLKKYYESDRKRYSALFRNNDIVLNLRGGVKDTVNMIDIIENSVKEDKLDERFIDNSVRRGLNARGWNVLVTENGKREVHPSWNTSKK